MDLSKAFDTINHELLLTKLTKLGFTHKSSKLMNSYLSNKTQFVEIDGNRSDNRVILTGVPQGSMIGPLLFITYINDMRVTMRVTFSISHFTLTTPHSPSLQMPRLMLIIIL